MMMSSKIKSLMSSWIRQQSKLANEVVTIEAEIQKLQNKKYAPDFIKSKSDRLDVIIDTVNTADDTIQTLRLMLIEQNMKLQAMAHLYEKAIEDPMKEVEFLLKGSLNQLEQATQQMAHEIIKKENSR